MSEKTVREVIGEIETKVKSAMKGRDQVLGFCTALAATMEAFGPETIVGVDGLQTGDLITSKLEVRICPDCGAKLKKRRALTAAGKYGVAWLCECDPAGLEVFGPVMQALSGQPEAAEEEKD